MDAITEIDKSIYVWVQSNLHSPLLDSIMPYLRIKTTWIPFYIVLLVFLWLKHGIKALWFALASILVVAITDPISSLWLKKLIGRPRPCEVPGLMQYFPDLTHCSAGFSMPSSHAANHYALASFLGLSQKKFYPKWNILLSLWAAIICFAQLYVGVHYPGDILVGAALGIFIGTTAFVSFKKIFKNTFHEL